MPIPELPDFQDFLKSITLEEPKDKPGLEKIGFLALSQESDVFFPVEKASTFWLEGRRLFGTKLLTCRVDLWREMLISF